MSSEDAATDLRTPLSLVLKTLTTHAFALASYAYASSLLRRPTHTHIQALRILFFLFVPTLPLVELLISSTRSLLQFLRNHEDEDDIHVRFYLSAALGMHAGLRQGDDEGNKDVKDQRKNMSLLDVGSHCAEKDLVPLNWAWFGRLLAALFGLTQAVGTIVMWVRRMRAREGDALSFDHRNGAMGIASAICGAISVVTLLLRRNWKVSKAFEVPQKSAGWLSTQRQGSTSILCGLLAMLLHVVIATLANRHNLWLYSSVGSLAFLITGSKSPWQSLVLIVFVFIFRADISRRLGSSKYLEWFGEKRMYRVKALLGFLLASWVVVDIVLLFGADVLQVVTQSRRRAPHGGYWKGYWWQDPLSDSLVVI